MPRITHAQRPHSGDVTPARRIPTRSVVRWHDTDAGVVGLLDISNTNVIIRQYEYFKKIFHTIILCSFSTPL